VHKSCAVRERFQYGFGPDRQMTDARPAGGEERISNRSRNRGRRRFAKPTRCPQGRDYGGEHIRLRFISVSIRLSVSGRWLSRRSARWVNSSTDGKPFDFENVAFPPHDKCVLVVEMHSATL
jgi:hypothetical protein